MRFKRSNLFIKVFLTLFVAVFIVGCNKSSPTAPAAPPVAPPPAGPVTYNVAVQVTDATSSNGLAAAQIVVLDGQFAGSTHVVSANGTLTLTGAQGNMNMEATHTGYRSMRRGVGPCATTGCTAAINFALERDAPWRREGVGANVFNMPTDLRRVRIQAIYTGSSENFVVRVGGSLIVNTILGTFWPSTTYDGVHLVSGGVVEVRFSEGVSWSITQVY